MAAYLNSDPEQISSAFADFLDNDSPKVRNQFELSLLELEAENRGIRLIPVVLASLPKQYAPSFPDKVKNLTWVDFREESPDPLENLINAIKKNNEPPMN